MGAAGKKSGVFPLIRFMFDREELRAALTEGEIEEEIRRHRRTLSKKDEKRIRVYGDVRLQLLGMGYSKLILRDKKQFRFSQIHSVTRRQRTLPRHVTHSEEIKCGAALRAVFDIFKKMNGKG